METIIVGGGLAGISAALNFQHLGVDFKLYEKSNSMDTYARVGLGISKNIFPILRKWNLQDETFAIGQEVKRMKFVDSKLKLLKNLQIKEVPISVERDKFHQLLASRINSQKVVLGQIIDSKDIAKDKLVIVAEGIHSQFRKEQFPEIKLRSTGQYIYRGISKVALPDFFHNSYIDVVGNHLRIASIPVGKNTYSWYAVVPAFQEGLDSQTALKNYVEFTFKNYSEELKELINQTETIYCTELQDINPASRKGKPWYHNNTVFIGDAIHATTPNLANGACLAIEDAVVLSDLLSKNPQNLQAAFKEFQHLREAKVNSVVRLSWLLGQSFHFKGKFADWLLKSSIKITPQLAFDTVYKEVLR